MEEKKQTFWVARDENGLLSLYEKRPSKSLLFQVWGGSKSIPLDNNLFPEVGWNDETPTEVEITIKPIKKK